MTPQLPHAPYRDILTAKQEMTEAMANDRYYARSASDRTDDWPFWFVADKTRGGLNVTCELIRDHIDPKHTGGVFTLRNAATVLANMANGKSMTGEAQ